MLCQGGNSEEGLATIVTAAAVVACTVGGPLAAGDGNSQDQNYDDTRSDAWKSENDESPASRPSGIDKIRNIVVIYGVNRAFDNSYGLVRSIPRG
jgi:phospholipase C